MLFTDDDLIEEFERRNVALNRRVLTDWRSKGYLERLQVKGKGRGRGKIYFSSRNALNRALLVDEALRLDYSGTQILFILWLFGYEVPSSVIRNHLLSALENLRKAAGGGKQDGSAISEHIENVVLEYYRIAQKYPQLNLSCELPDVGMEMILNVFANREYDLSELAFEEGIEAVLSTFKQDRIQPPAETAVDRLQNAKNEWQYVHNHFSLAHFHDAITAATDEHISRVQADVGLIFRVIAERAKGKPELERLREFCVLFAYGFGMLFIPINLIVRHQGWGGFIDQYLNSCEVLLVHNIEEE